MIDDKAAQWLLEQQQYQRDWALALALVLEQIVRGETVTFACSNCGRLLGVFDVQAGASQCVGCDRATRAKPSAHARSA